MYQTLGMGMVHAPEPVAIYKENIYVHNLL